MAEDRARRSTYHQGEKLTCLPIQTPRFLFFEFPTLFSVYDRVVDASICEPNCGRICGRICVCLGSLLVIIASIACTIYVAVVLSQNTSTEVAKACCLLRGERRWALTGSECSGVELSGWSEVEWSGVEWGRDGCS